MTAAQQPAPLDEIADLENSIALLSLRVKNLAGLLETLSDAGYGEASAGDDKWQRKWWEQAGCIADVAADLAQQIHDQAEQIGTARYALQCAADARPAPVRRSS